MELFDITKEILFSNDPTIFLSNLEKRSNIGNLINNNINNYQENFLDVNRAVFLATSSIYRNPFSTDSINDDHPILKEMVLKYQLKVCEVVAEKYNPVLANLPTSDGFEEWVKELIQKDGSNANHPLFKYLQADATLSQLIEFITQESPFDMYFSDIMSSMQPGHYGNEREEMLENFRDEMGHGDQTKFHRNLRVDMMKEFDIPIDIHLENIEYFNVSQLVLANYYLMCVPSRRAQNHLVGMMLA